MRSKLSNEQGRRDRADPWPRTEGSKTVSVGEKGWTYWGAIQGRISEKEDPVGDV